MVLPMAIQNLINVGVSAADVAILGRVGEKVLSGASLAGQVQFVMTLIFYGITSGITVLTAQYWGKGDRRSIEKVMGMGLTSAILVGALFTMAAIFIPETIMKIFTSDPLVMKEAVKYLQIIGFSYICMAITQVYLNVMRSIERVIIATLTYTISLFVNIVINAVLIFGLFGFPEMGIKGAAIGTLVARTVELLIVLFYANKLNDVVRIKIKNLFIFDKVLLKDYMVYAMPVIINELFWGLGFSAHSAIIGHLGSEAVAANAVAQVLRQFSMVVVFGVSNATAVYLGKTIGEKKYEHAKAYAKRFVFISVVMGAIAAVVILCASPIAKTTMELSELSKQYLTFMNIVMAGYSFCMAISCTLIVGVFRAGGDTKFALIVDTVIMWAICIPLGFLAAFVFKWGVPVVYVFLLSDEMMKLPVSIKRFLSYKWLNNVTR